MAKLVRVSLTDQISDYIQGKIKSGEWKPGEKIPSETELAEKLGVSRMSLRNGIQRCNALGITETRAGEGTFVRDFSLRSYFTELHNMDLLGKTPGEINDLRYILQIGSLRLALYDHLITQADIDELEGFLKSMNQSLDARDMESFHIADARFHRAICHLSKNTFLFNIYDAIEMLINDTARRNVEWSIGHHASDEHVRIYHQRLFDSIKNEDIEGFIDVLMNSSERTDRPFQKTVSQKSHI